MNNYYEEALDSILSLRAKLSESLQENRSQYSIKNILLIVQRPTGSKEFYVIKRFSLTYLLHLLQSMNLCFKVFFGDNEFSYYNKRYISVSHLVGHLRFSWPPLFSAAIVVIISGSFCHSGLRKCAVG